MGFFDNLGKIAEYAFDKAKEKSNEIQQIKEEFESYSDNKLIQIYKNGSSSYKRAIAKKILEERGVI